MREEGRECICIQTFSLVHVRKTLESFLARETPQPPKHTQKHRHTRLSPNVRSLLVTLTSTTQSVLTIHHECLIFTAVTSHVSCFGTYVCFFDHFPHVRKEKKHRLQRWLTREFQGKVGEKQIQTSCHSLWQVSENH